MNVPKGQRSGVNRRHVLGGAAGIAAASALGGIDLAQALEAGASQIASTTAGKVRGLSYRGVGRLFAGRAGTGGPTSGAGALPAADRARAME